MSVISIIESEITTDLLGLGYAAYIPSGSPTVDQIHKEPIQQAANQNIADKFNALDTGRKINIIALQPKDIFGAMVSSEVDVVTGDNVGKLGWILNQQSINPFDPVTVQIFKSAFGVGSVTLVNLNALRFKVITRAEELFLPFIKPGWVAMARSKGV